MLRSMLSEDPSIVDCSEIFNPDLNTYYPTFWTFAEARWRDAAMPSEAPHAIGREERIEDFRDYFAHLDRVYPDRQKLMDIKYHDVAAVDSARSPETTPAILSMLMSAGVAIIHMSRINLLEQHCSQLLAVATATWVLGKDRGDDSVKPRSHHLRVPISGLLETLVLMRERMKIAELWLGNYPRVLRLKYEQVLVDLRLAPDVRESVEDLVGRRLDITGRPATAKAAPRLAELVENYGEVREALRDTEFSWCTEEVAIADRYPRTRLRLAATNQVGRRPAPPARGLVFVLSAERAGGQLVRSTIAAAISARNFDEPFNPELAGALPARFDDFIREPGRLRGPVSISKKGARSLLDAYFDWLADMLDGRTGVLGLRHDQLRAFDWPPVSPDEPPHLLSVIAERGHPIVHVSRRDRLAQYASLQLARRTGIWVTRPGARLPPPPPLRIDVAEMLRFFHTRAAEEALVDGWLQAGLVSTRLVYEDLVDGIHLSADAREALRGIGIGLASEVYLTGRKLARPLAEWVENLDEAVAAVNRAALELQAGPRPAR